MWDKMKEKRNEGGFTLIELLIVIIILAILAAIVVFAVGTTSKNAVAASCRADAKSVETAAEAFHAQTGTYPADESTLTGTYYTYQAPTYYGTSSTGAGANGTASVGPWLRSVPGTAHYTISVNNNGTLDVQVGTVVSNFDTDPSICDSAS
jgi:general secretion pathway protein G